MIDYELIKSNFQNYLKGIEQHNTSSSSWIDAINNSYDVEDMAFETLTIQEVLQLHQDIILKYQSRQLKKTWCENQNKLFMWILCQWEAVNKKKASDFIDSDWEMITGCLPRKSVEDVKFQYKMLTKTSVNEVWKEDQLNLLNQIIADQKLQNKWNEVSRQLFKLSDQKYFRRPKQCRQQWKNHLDPQIEKGDWSSQDDYELLELVLQIGKKWSSISKCIGKRTEHAVKNRFHSLIKQYTKMFKKNSKSKTICKRKDQQQELINYMMKCLKQKQQTEEQQIKVIIPKKKPAIKTKVIKSDPTPKITFEEPKNIFPTPTVIPPQANLKQMFMREEIDNRIGYVYSPLTPFSYLDKNKQPLGNLLLITSPRIISPRFKMITQWQDFDNKEYFCQM